MSVYSPMDDTLGQAGAITSVEFFTALAENLNYLMDSMPVGSRVYIMVGLPGVPTPDPTIWQACDGSEILNTHSPIRNKDTPNRTQAGGLYPRQATSLGTIGFIEGSNYQNLTHSHGGNTQDAGPDGSTEEEHDHPGQSPHHHGINADIGVVNFEPRHIVLKSFLKIL
jgi:hypothetical protein